MILFIFSNPIYHQGDIFVEINSYQNIKDVRFEIYDLNGRSILKENISVTSNLVSINVSEKIKASGFYILKIFLNEQSYTYKFSLIN